MKRITVILIMLLSASTLFAQKIGFVDSDYIRSNIPAFVTAQEQLDALAQQWEKEVADGYEVVEKLYKDYQNEVVMLSQEMRVQREEAIIAKEREIKDLQNKYFGVEGELFLKRSELIQPIQDEILNAIKQVANEGGVRCPF
jgi:outer membrane protein